MGLLNGEFNPTTYRYGGPVRLYRLEENSLFDLKEFDSLVATIHDDEMPTREVTADLKRLKSLLREAKASIDDFVPEDLGLETVPVVDRDLDRIWIQATGFRTEV